MYDIFWDDIFDRLYIDDRPEFPDYTDDELEAIEERGDCWLMGVVGIL